MRLESIFFCADVLQVSEGSLYPVLLEQEGVSTAKRNPDGEQPGQNHLTPQI